MRSAARTVVFSNAGGQHQERLRDGEHVGEHSSGCEVEGPLRRGLAAERLAKEGHVCDFVLADLIEDRTYVVRHEPAFGQGPLA